MLVIRLNHIKYAVGDHVYRARGSNTPRPRPGDMGLLISCSGENPTVIKWAENLSLSRTHLFGVVGRSESSLAKIIKNRIVLESRCIEPGVPRDFYMYASFVLSPLPIKLIERFREEGLNLPESILRYYHSTVE
jgi:fructoselysine-6-P-deglycase FrlB-like protein